jgi:hypothetical protein
VVQLVEALRYKLEGRGFDPRCCHSGRTMALKSTHPLTVTNTMNIFWEWEGGKDGRCAGLTTCHLHVPIVLKSGSINLLESSEPAQAFTCMFYGPSVRVTWLTSACSPNAAMLVASEVSYVCAVNELASCCRTPLLCLLPVCNAIAGFSGYLFLCYSSIMSEWSYQLLRKSVTCVSLLLIIVIKSKEGRVQWEILNKTRNSELRHKMSRWTGRHKMRHRVRWETL